MRYQWDKQANAFEQRGQQCRGAEVEVCLDVQQEQEPTMIGAW